MCCKLTKCQKIIKLNLVVVFLGALQLAFCIDDKCLHYPPKLATSKNLQCILIWGWGWFGIKNGLGSAKWVWRKDILILIVFCVGS
jgi:hypothetical protein